VKCFIRLETKYTKILLHNQSLCIISDTVHLLDLIHARRCLQRESVLVNSAANYGACHGRMLSGLGRNVQTCCEHFSLSTSMLHV